LAFAITAAFLPRRKRVGLSLRALAVRAALVEVLGTAGGVVKVTSAPLLDPWALAATSTTVYVVEAVRPVSGALTACGALPAPTCCAQGSDPPGEIVKWQSLICEPFGLTLPLSVAPTSVRALGDPVTAVGAGAVQAIEIEGWAPLAVGTSEKSDTPGPGAPEDPPPPPPPPPLATCPTLIS
jgi:hypothetical protein